MAEYLKMKTYHVLARPQLNAGKPSLMLLMGLACLLLASPAQSEPLNDPTQPPISLYNADDSRDAAEITGPVLQSVMLGRHYRAAIISGEKVMLGHKYAQSTLIKVNEREAVLRHADQSTQTLVLNQIIIKKVITSATGPSVAKNKLQSKSTAKHLN
jgi:CO dehydrogenase/acetyl-CoA synthase gamma subunit (corrinoid Fe-S protein)